MSFLPKSLPLDDVTIRYQFPQHYSTGGYRKKHSTCDSVALSEVEVREIGTAGDDSSQASVVQRGALGHVQVGQAQRLGTPATIQ